MYVLYIRRCTDTHTQCVTWADVYIYIYIYIYILCMYTYYGYKTDFGGCYIENVILIH